MVDNIDTAFFFPGHSYGYFGSQQHKKDTFLGMFGDIRDGMVQWSYCWVDRDPVSNDSASEVEDFLPLPPNFRAFPLDVDHSAKHVATPEA